MVVLGKLVKHSFDSLACCYSLPPLSQSLVLSLCCLVKDLHFFWVYANKEKDGRQEGRRKSERESGISGISEGSRARREWTQCHCEHWSVDENWIYILWLLVGHVGGGVVRKPEAPSPPPAVKCKEEGVVVDEYPSEFGALGWWRGAPSNTKLHVPLPPRPGTGTSV